jgi:hypothetical protein
MDMKMSCGNIDVMEYIRVTRYAQVSECVGTETMGIDAQR